MTFFSAEMRRDPYRRIALDALIASTDRWEIPSDWKPREAFNVHGPASLPIRFCAR